MQTVRIRTNQENYGTEVMIGGTSLGRVRSASYNQRVGVSPAFWFELSAYPDIEIDGADVNIQFSPETCRDAMRVIRHNVFADKEFRKAFLASICSALNEIPEDINISAQDAAERILNRIIGVD